WTGAGLLLLLLLAGIALVLDAFSALRGTSPIGPAVLDVLTTVLGILLLAGLWTPLEGGLVAAIELWHALSQPGDPLNHIMLATQAAALALLGHGTWSVDDYLFTSTRIELSDRR